MSDTKNALVDFDMAAALSLAGINGQLKGAWKVWKEALPGLVEFSYDDSPQGQADRAVERIHRALVGAPQLGVQSKADGLHRSGLMTLELPLQRVACSARDGKKADLQKLTLRCTVHLGRELLTLEELRKRREEEAATKVAEILDEFSVNESALSIECLYLDLASARLVNASCDGLPVSADVVASFVQAFFSTQKKLIINMALRPRRLERKPTFSLKALMHHFTPNGDRPAFSTVDYLGVFEGGLSMPERPDEAFSKLGAWLGADAVSGKEAMHAGVMALRGSMAAQGISAALENELRKMAAEMEARNQPVRQAKGSSLNPGHDLPEPEADFLACVKAASHDHDITVSIDKSYDWTSKADSEEKRFKLNKRFTLAAKPEGDGYKLSGKLCVRFEEHLEFDASRAGSGLLVTLAGSTIFGPVKICRETRAEVDMDGALELYVVPHDNTAAGARTIRMFDIKARLKNGGLVLGGVRQWSFLTEGMPLDVIGPMGMLDLGASMERYARDSIDAVCDMLVKAFSRLGTGVDDFMLVPPGENCFSFASPRFSGAGDLLLDIQYRAASLQQ